MPQVSGRPPFLELRDDAPEAVAAIFREIVSTAPTEHFRPVDGHLVEQYAQSIARAREAYAELEREGPVVNNKTSPWVVVLEKAHRSSVALSARLRLDPQHRGVPTRAHVEHRGCGVDSVRQGALATGRRRARR